MDIRDIEYIKNLVNKQIQEYKNEIAGIKHFMEYKIRIGEPTEKDVKKIKEFTEKLEYANNLLKKVDEKWRGNNESRIC